jgi:hypothetical protein
MLPLILGSAGLGAALGGIQGYQQSGGDLGKTAQAALSGGLLGGVTGGLGSAAGGLAAGRMAGMIPLNSLLQKQAMGLGLTGIEKALLNAPKLAGGAANIGTQLAGAALLAPAAGAVGNLASQAFGGPARAAQAALGTGAAMGVPGLGAQQPGPFTPVTAVPEDLQARNRQLGSLDVIDPTKSFAAGRLAAEKDMDTQVRNMQKLINLQYPVLSQVKKDEMQRNLAAAQIRSNIATQADAIRGSLATSQQMGANAASQMGSALAAQYQYS